MPTRARGRPAAQGLPRHPLTAAECAGPVKAVGSVQFLKNLAVAPGDCMCTPHGRHGSKLRTARMMSMPLKLSGPFSSKIGVF